MQQPETTVLHRTPSRVRFNLTLILAVAVILFGLYQLFTEVRSGDDAPTDGGGQPAGEGENQSSGRGGGGAWLLIVVGLGVGAYSWLTSPRQYWVYSDALIIMFGTPRKRTIHFSDIREVVNDRGFMGDPLRVYTVNRRRIALQVREPEIMHQELQAALGAFRRAYPQYAPPPDEAEADDAGPDVVDSTIADTPEPAPETPEAADPAPDAGQQRSQPSRRRSLRDEGYDSNRDDSRPRFS